MADIIEHALVTKKYDFRSPKKFNKDQQRTLESLHENLGRHLMTYFTTTTRENCEIKINKIEEQRYFEFSNQIKENTIMLNFDMLPIDQSIEECTMFINFLPDLGFYLVDKLLGGSGSGVKYERDFTELELMIFDNVFSKISTSVNQSWNKYLEIDCLLKNIETNPRVVQIMAPEEIVLKVEYSMIIDQLSTVFKVYFPAISLAQLMDKFTPNFTRNIRKQDAEKEEMQRNIILDSLKLADVSMTTVLDEIQVDVADLLQLQVGDVIPLSKHYDSNVVIKVDHTPWFEAKLGETRHHKAVQIEKLITKEN